jgi:hypothetical protein
MMLKLVFITPAPASYDERLTLIQELSIKNVAIIVVNVKYRSPFL